MDLTFQKFFFFCFIFFLDCEFLVHSKDEKVAYKGQEHVQAFFKISEVHLWMFCRDLLLLSNMRKVWGDEVSIKKEQEMQPPPKI